MKKIFSLFNSVCAIFPFGIAGICAAICLLGGWEFFLPGHSPEFYLLPRLKHNLFAFIFVLFIGIAFFLIIRANNWIKNKSKHQWALCVLSAATIFLFTLTIRLILCYIFRDDLKPFGDFYRAWDIAHGNYSEHLSYYSLFPAYLGYSIYLRNIIVAFSDQYVCVLYLNALFAGITAVCLYFIAINVTGNDVIAILAGMFYAFMPSNIVYTSVGTPEFLTIGFNAVGTLLFTCAIKNASLKKKIFFSLLGGIAVGIGSIFKTFGLVIVIAYSMTCVFLEIDKKMKKYCGRKELLKRTTAMVFCMAIVWSSHVFVTDSALKYTEHVFQINVNSETAIPQFLLIGLNTEGEGQIHIGTKSRQYYIEYLNNGLDAFAAKEHAYHILKEDWDNNSSKIVPLFAKKMIWAWQDDLMPVVYFNNYVGLNPDSVAKKMIADFSMNIVPSIAQIYYALMILFGIFGVVHFSKFNINFQWEFLLLIVFGYWCMIMLSEAQSRYKCLVMPFICVIGAAGLNGVVHILKKRLSKAR